MKIRIILISIALFATTAATAQTDTTFVSSTPEPTLDSLLLGADIYRYAAQTKVRVNRTLAVDSALTSYISNNSKRTLHGYRIRLFFDNKQNARGESEKVENLFKEYFPTIPIYRSYINPYFKVVAGDYRTRSDAMRELGAIKQIFPNAFIIKENINFPQL